jgi:uncharacterized protein (TIGR02001 family)
MINKHILGVLCVPVMVLSSAPAFATSSDTDFEFSGNAGIISEYSFRGIAQSDEQPAIQGGFDVSHTSGFYAGVWGSNVDFNDGDEASVELDVYAGYSGDFGNFNYDIGAIYYAYPGADTPRDYDYYELSAAVGYDFDVLATSLAFNYSPDNFNETGDAEYLSLAVDVPLPQDFSLNTHVGYQWIDDHENFGIAKDYTDWSVGLGYELQGFDLSLQYVDTNLDEPEDCADGCGPGVLFGVSRSF